MRFPKPSTYIMVAMGPSAYRWLQERVLCGPNDALVLEWADFEALVYGSAEPRAQAARLDRLEEGLRYFRMQSNEKRRAMGLKPQV